MTFLWALLAFVLLGALIFWRLLATAARWGNEYLELADHGVITTGTVLRKIVESGRHGAHSRYIRYTYADQFGTPHVRKKMMVTDDAWETLEEGGPIAVVYSQRTPKINAPQYLMDTVSKAAPPPDLADKITAARWRQDR